MSPLQTDSAGLAAHLAELEDHLLHHDHARDPRRLESLLAHDLIEIDADGRRVGRDAILGWLLSRPTEARWELSELQGQAAGDGVFLLQYRARQTAGGGSGRPSWHASLWRRTTVGDWQLCFHQATRITPESG